MGYFYTKKLIIAVNTVEDISQTRICLQTDGQKNGQTGRRTDGRTNLNQYIPPPTALCFWYKKCAALTILALICNLWSALDQMLREQWCINSP